MSTRSSHVAPVTWRCLLCATTGEQLSRDLAARAFAGHWATQHEETSS